MLHNEHIAFLPFSRQFLFTVWRECRHNEKRMFLSFSGRKFWFIPPTKCPLRVEEFKKRRLPCALLRQ